MTDTVLVITGLDVPPLAARGLRQTLEPITAAQQTKRDINGTLFDVSAEQFQKYRSVITCTDSETVAHDDVWPGALLTVDCVAELRYAAGSAGNAKRTIVPGSEYEEGDYVFYRPRLTMRMVAFRALHDEAGATCGWELVLEEV